MTGPCSLCGEPVVIDGHGTAREVHGWELPRRQGGLNALVARKETGRLACPRCVSRLRAGIATEQLALFEP